jgi:hypothetical protein
VLQKNVFSSGYWLLTPASSAVQIFLKLLFSPADELSANSKNQGPERREKLFGPMGRKRT